MLQVKPARTKSFRQTRKPILLVVNSRLLNLFYCVLHMARLQFFGCRECIAQGTQQSYDHLCHRDRYYPRADRLLLHPAAQPRCQYSQQKRPPKEFVLPVTYPPKRMCSSTDHRVSVGGEPVEAFGHPQGCIGICISSKPPLHICLRAEP